MATSPEILEKLAGLTENDLKVLMKVDPKLFEKISKHITVEQQKDERLRCEDSLVEFLIAAWPHIGEPEPLDLNWHHEVIAGYLEAQAYGDYQNVIVNQPPRTTKSLLCSVALPGWIWAQPKEKWNHRMGPHVQFFCLSYNKMLTDEIATKNRRLVMSEWYQSHWGHQVSLREDQQNKSNFQLEAGGGRVSNSIEGGVLGRGGIWQLIDDPHHVKGAESDLQRAETLEGMRALVTRVNNPRHSARTLVMQRLHRDDATNYALENWRGRTKHIMFPMKLDTLRQIEDDPRREDGELLWPRRWTAEAVAAEENELGEYGTAGQLQQSPVPRGGGVIKEAWWRLWPDDAERDAGNLLPYKCYRCQWEQTMSPQGSAVTCPMCGAKAEVKIVYPDTSFRMLFVDTAYSEADVERNSFNAITRWGVWHSKDDAPRAMLMQAWQGRVPLRGGHYDRRDPTVPQYDKGLVEIVHDMATLGEVDAVVIEKKTRGVDLNAELERLTRPWPYRIEFFEPTGRGDKVARLVTCTALFTNDMVWAPGKQWARTVIDQVSAVPRAKHDDLADTVSGSLIYMREYGLLPLSYEYEAEKRRNALFAPSREGIRELYEEV
jgi:DNA-directed RNA polymerase subunit RPC12/RpoP